MSASHRFQHRTLPCRIAIGTAVRCDLATHIRYCRPHCGTRNERMFAADDGWLNVSITVRPKHEKGVATSATPIGSYFLDYFPGSSTDKILPAGSLNQAIFGPGPFIMPRASVFRSGRS